MRRESGPIIYQSVNQRLITLRSCRDSLLSCSWSGCDGLRAASKLNGEWRHAVLWRGAVGSNVPEHDTAPRNRGRSLTSLLKKRPDFAWHVAPLTAFRARSDGRIDTARGPRFHPQARGQ